jgi:hypothetical protein
MIGLGAVYRADGRKYSELVKLGVIFGLILGLTAAFISLIFGARIFPNFIVGIGTSLFIAILTFIITAISIILGLIISAFIYDIGNALMEN